MQQLFLTAAALVGMLHLMKCRSVSNCELIRWKCHASENIAGVLFGTRQAFLVGNCVLGRVDEVLRGAHYSHY